ARSASERCEPMKPAPPVTRYLNFRFTSVPGPELSMMWIRFKWGNRDLAPHRLGGRAVSGSGCFLQKTLPLSCSDASIVATEESGSNPLFPRECPRRRARSFLDGVSQRHGVAR